MIKMWGVVNSLLIILSRKGIIIILVVFINIAVSSLLAVMLTKSLDFMKM